MPVDQTLESLRATIHQLEPNGSEGFEGLMRGVLTEITARSFALADPGTQHGRDGQSGFDGAILFEAKLYKDGLRSADVLAKIAQVAVKDNGSVDLWILGATAPVSSQIAEDARQLGEKSGLYVLIADWQPDGLAVLAALLAMAPEAAAAFLVEHAGADQSEVARQLAHVRGHPQFSAREAELRAALDQPSIAPAYALPNNRQWLRNAFGSAERALAVFGQRLAPADPSSVTGTVERLALRATLAESMFAAPDGNVVAVVGGEGNGKSWIFAQVWLSEPDPPLTVVIIPADIRHPFSHENLESLLITKLIQQTNDVAMEATTRRWLKFLRRWQRGGAPQRPRLVVVLDGINQRPSLGWFRIISAFHEYLEGIGGRLVFTTRELFYSDHLNRRLHDVTRINVPEWTTDELNALLEARGIAIDSLSAPVIGALRNPRMFAIATQLLDNADIEAFQELSVSRLLFEHLRSGGFPESDAIPVGALVSNVCMHASLIVERLQQEQSDDLTVFNRPAPTSDGTLADQLLAASEGRFYVSLAGEPFKYKLNEDGLGLALGFALIDAAKRAVRNGKSVEEALAKLLDPIAALDKTAEILIAALIVATLDDAPEGEIVATLARMYVGLQNLDYARYNEFKALVRRLPAPFIRALEDAVLAEQVYTNLSWLVDALLENRVHCAAEIAQAVNRWLSMYSLAPERWVFSAESGARRVEQLSKAQRDLEARRNALSPAEATLLSSMILEERGDYTDLNEIACQLLAGQSLVSHADALVKWCFADALNGGYRRANDNFYQLTQLNRIDWAETRAALLAAAEIFTRSDTSKTGQWALVKVLLATGSSEDAERATSLSRTLREDTFEGRSWRRIEQYCATDPCDPDAPPPENIADTAAEYTALDVSHLRAFFSHTQEDYVFDEARTGLARFDPSTAIAVMRKFSEQALSRSTAQFRFAVFLLENHTSALDDSVAPAFVAKAAQIAQEAHAVGDPNKDSWVAGQFALAVAFPHLTAEAQLRALVKRSEDETIMIDLLILARDCDASTYEDALQRAVDEGNELAQYRVLAFGQYTNTVMTATSKSLIGILMSSASARVRSCAFAIAYRLKDRQLLERVVESGWSATTTDVARAAEVTTGSQALALAASEGLISVEGCLERIAFDGYTDLAVKLGPVAALAVAARLDVAIRRAAGYRSDEDFPEMVLRLNVEGWLPAALDVTVPEPQDETQRERFSRIANSDEGWRERERHAREGAAAFRRRLTQQGADLILRSVTVELVEAVLAADPAVVRAWQGYMMSLDATSLGRVHNVALLVAQALSAMDLPASEALFGRLQTSDPLIRFTYGSPSVTLDALALWEATDSVGMNAIRFERLDTAATDHQLAQEVLAAVQAGKQAALREYVLDRRARPEPSFVACAIMVAGFSEESDWALQTLDRYKDSHGLIERAHRAATYAMERHRWSKYWAKRVAEAQSPTEFWQCAVLLCKIVDGRFNSREIVLSATAQAYGPSINRLIRDRIKKWSKKRGEKLFGDKAPDVRYLRAAP